MSPNAYSVVLRVNKMPEIVGKLVYQISPLNHKTVLLPCCLQMRTVSALNHFHALSWEKLYTHSFSLDVITATPSSLAETESCALTSSGFGTQLQVLTTDII